MNRRRGISLIEMMIVIGASSMVLLAGVGLLHRLMRSERVAAESLVHATNHARLSAQFRDDVHAATAATARGEPGADHILQLAAGDAAQITYSQQDRTLIRTETRQTQPTRHDQFHLPDDVRVRFAVSDASPQKIAELTWERVQADSATKTATTHRRLNPLRIEAIVGKDHRFQEAAP